MAAVLFVDCSSPIVISPGTFLESLLSFLLRVALPTIN